jgi:predicted RND superfamily exporter protein
MAYVARRFISLIVLASAAVAGFAALASEALGFSADFATATAVVVFALLIALGSSLGFRLESRRRGRPTHDEGRR